MLACAVDKDQGRRETLFRFILAAPIGHFIPRTYLKQIIKEKGKIIKLFFYRQTCCNMLWFELQILFNSFDLLICIFPCSSKKWERMRQHFYGFEFSAQFLGCFMKSRFPLGFPMNFPLEIWVMAIKHSFHSLRSIGDLINFNHL